MVHKEPRVHRVHRVHKESMELRARLVHKESMELRARMVHKESMELRVHRVLRGLRDRSVVLRLELPTIQVRREEVCMNKLQ